MKPCYSSVRILREDDKTDKLVFEFPRMRRAGKVICSGNVYRDCFNDAEPYDRKTHVFRLPRQIAEQGCEVRLKTRLYFFPPISSSAVIRPGDLRFETPRDALALCDNALTKIKEDTEDIAAGLTYAHGLYENKNGAPVHVFTLTADMKKCRLYLGTPDDGCKNRRVKATIPEMIAAAEKNGKTVLASINGDFFDILGDMHPSGLTVKNGRVIANGDSRRAFAGMTKDGRAVITDLASEPGILRELDLACGALQRIVKDGKICDYAPIESFGYTPHPRSAAGVTADGRAVLTVVDGRIPDYSNGASLYDLAGLMLERGCVDAVNLDGGGSSAVYTKKDGGFALRSVPADLYKPNDKLIRKEADCIMVIKND